MHIVKDNIPKNASFILRSSILERMIQDAGISVQVDLHQMHSAILFEAFFWSPRPGVPQERFFVRAGTVPASQAQDFRFQLESRVLPEFIPWACGILALPLNSTVRRSDQEFRW